MIYHLAQSYNTSVTMITVYVCLYLRYLVRQMW